MQSVAVGPTSAPALDLARRLGLDAEIVADSPFLLVGSATKLIDKLQRQRDDLGINHIVVRDYRAFAPIVEQLRCC